MFTSVATLQLIDRGLLALNSGASDFLALEDTEISEEVTICHPLPHASGIGDDWEEEDRAIYDNLRKPTSDNSLKPKENFLPRFSHKAANFPPGQSCHYRNCMLQLQPATAALCSTGS